MPHHLIDNPEIEYVEGLAYPKVSSQRKHSAVQLAMATIVKRCARGRGLVGPEWRFHLAAKTELVPDVAFVSYERLRPLNGDDLEEPPFAPDIAVEVRSPSDRDALIIEKTKHYLAHGAELVINIDPQTRTLTAHTVQKPETRFSSGDTFSCEQVRWLVFEVHEAFADIDIPR
jgi:Uma2 family endonuclease